MSISVNYKLLELHASGLNDFIDSMKELSSQIEREGKKISAMEIRMTPICARLNRVLNCVQANCDCLQQIRTALECAVVEYRSVERRLCGADSNMGSMVPGPAYLTLNQAEMAFSSFNFSTHFLDDLSGLSVFGYFFSHFNDNLKAAVNSGNFLDNLRNGTLLQRIADEYMNDKEKVKGLLSGVLEEMFKNKVDLDYGKDRIKAFQVLETLAAEPFSEDIRKIIDENHEAVDHLGKSAEATEKILYLLTDYSDNVELLKSLKNAAPKNEALNEVVDELLYDYQNKFTALLRDEVVDKVEDFAKKSLDTIAGTNFKLVNTVIKGTIGQVPVMGSIDTVIHISGLKQGAIRTYRTAVETIKSGVYGGADMQAYKNSFNLCKELTLKEYNAMLSCYEDPNSEQRKYLSSQIEVLERMSYDNVTGIAPPAEIGGGGRSGGGF